MKYTPDDERTHNPLVRVQQIASHGLNSFVEKIYLPLLEKSMHHRYTTAALFLAGLTLSIGLVYSNYVKFEFFPSVPSDFMQANLTMNDGTSPETRNQALMHMEQAIHAVETDYLQRHPDEEKFLKYILVFANGDLGGGVVMELTKPEQRSINANELEKLWRARVGTTRLSGTSNDTPCKMWAPP